MPYRYGKNGNNLYCYEAADGPCHDAKLIARKPSSFQNLEAFPFQDLELEEASKYINEILDKIREDNKDPNRNLVFLDIAGSGFLLAWATPILGQQGSEEELIKTFAIDLSKD